MEINFPNDSGVNLSKIIELDGLFPSNTLKGAISFNLSFDVPDLINSS